MEQDKTSFSLLELIERPAFCVRDGIVVQANQAARQMLLTPGIGVADLIKNNLQAYHDFSGGSVSLTVTVADTTCKAQVIRTDNCDVFVLDSGNPELRAIALAAQHLRSPLNSVMTVADHMKDSEDPKSLGQLQRGLHRLHRIVCNMSDSYRYQQDNAARLETTDITSVFDECMEAIGTHLSACGIQLKYTGLSRIVLGLADREMLERAVYNLISNAVKFMTAGSTLEAKLTQTGSVLCFTVQDQGQCFTPENQSAFCRYLREPGVEDSRHGIGLGMALVRAVAASHGGTVLIDHPDGLGTRVTMTISVTSSSESMVRSSIQLPVSNYAGDRDRGLLELSEILPADAYQNMD